MLGEFDANSSVGGVQAFIWIGTAAFSGTQAGELHYANAADGNTYVEGDINGDGVADMVIRLNGTYTLSQADFTGITV